MDGEESVMQMVGPGKPIIETSILLNSPFPASAQATNNAKILSIPASIIRESIKDNQNLARNMLASMANQSKDLINQLGQLTLKTAKQRVGWFLLNLLLKDNKQSNNINLPYDKSLIASYLGMKPETFSRVLQSLKDDEELDIKRNVITLSDAFSLCQYCDGETASKCVHHNSDKCTEGDII